MKRHNKVAFALGATIAALVVGMVVVKKLNEAFEDMDFLGTFDYPEGCGCCEQPVIRGNKHVDERPSVLRHRRSV